MGNRNRGRRKAKPRDLIKDPEWAVAISPLFHQLMSLLELKEAPFALDRGIAITVGAHLERFLEEGLNFKLANTQGETLRRLYAEDGPLGSFSKKIEMSFAMGVIEEETWRDLNIIRTLRNVFAHATAPVTFDTELLAVECSKLHPAKFFGPDIGPLDPTLNPRQIFIVYSVVLMLKLYLDLTLPMSQAALETARERGDPEEIAKAEKAVRDATISSQIFPIIRTLVVATAAVSKAKSADGSPRLVPDIPAISANRN